MTTNLMKYSLGASVVVVAAGFAAWYFIAPPKQAQLMPGRIQGSTTYPSEGVPAQIVCAQPVSGGETDQCVQTQEGDNAHPELSQFSITVAPGTYNVYAKLKDAKSLGSDFGDYKAFYTKFVTCGLEYSCKDHTTIPVVVGSGEVIRDIRPWDWYQ